MKELTCASIICELLEAEYGTDLLDELSRPFLTRQQAINNSVKMSKMKKKFQERMTTFRLVTDIHASWPHKISREIVFKRLNEYLQGTLWSLPPPCAVCSRQIHETDVISLIVDGNTSSLPHHLDMLNNIPQIKVVWNVYFLIIFCKSKRFGMCICKGFSVRWWGQTHI